MTKAKREFYLERSLALGNDTRRCDWPECEGEGEHRAPRSRDEIKSYYWFCLEHVRIYNKTWNYYAGMTDDEVEVDRRKDDVGRRPSWPLGSGKIFFAFKAKEAFDDFGEFGGNGTKVKGQGKIRTKEDEAMAVLDLLPPVTPRAVKSRYKELVKRHHPDANNGDKASEEKFKQISQAYETIMAYLEN